MKTTTGKVLGGVACVIIGLFISAQSVRADSESRLGVGVNYWRMIDNIDVDNIDENGASWLLTYQYRLSALTRLEADLEIFDSGFQGIDGTTYAPEAFFVLGMGIYAAVGVGILYSDGDFADEVFYALRAGVDLEVLPQFYLDLNVNYRFADWSNLSDSATDIDGDTVMLGAAIRYEFR